MQHGIDPSCLPLRCYASIHTSYFETKILQEHFKIETPPPSSDSDDDDVISSSSKIVLNQETGEKVANVASDVRRALAV